MLAKLLKTGPVFTIFCKFSFIRDCITLSCCSSGIKGKLNPQYVPVIFFTEGLWFLFFIPLALYLRCWWTSKSSCNTWIHLTSNIRDVLFEQCEILLKIGTSHVHGMAGLVREGEAPICAQTQCKVPKTSAFTAWDCGLIHKVGC